MKHLKVLAVFILLSSLSSCAVMAPNFSVKNDFWQDKSKTVGVAIVKLPTAMAHKTGNQGLLDIAINNANAGELEAHLTRQDISHINEVADKIVGNLKSKGMTVKRITTPIDLESLPTFEKENDDSKKIYYANHDYASLKSKLGVDKLVVLSVNMVGTMRNYYGFFPIGDPSGYAALGGKIINLSNNQLEWNQVVVQSVPHGSAAWDTPPEFQSLTNAMYVAYQQARGTLLNHFVQ